MRRNDYDNDKYFEWLLEEIDIIEGTDGLFEDHFKALSLLFETDFRWSIEKDWNRVCDGLELRNAYKKSTGIGISEGEKCSVLEVLIGLSRRISEDILGDEDDKNLKKHWFWTWFYNLGLMNFGGDKFDRFEVAGRIAVWLNRDFFYDGLGSPFPLVEPPCDQRECEIWKQVMLYLAENGE